MAEKRSFPPNNPLSREDAATVASSKTKEYGVNVNKGGGLGDHKRERGRAKPVEALLKCLMCGRLQKLVFTYGKPPGYHRCIWCGELQPADGYRVIAYGSDLPQPMAPQEMELRRREFEAGKGDTQ